MSNKKNVLITGATSGIGKQLAIQFAKNGYDLIIVAEHGNELEQVAQELRQLGSEVFTIEKDLARDQAGQQLYDEVKVLGRQVDVLVNDAGVGQHGSFTSIPYEKYAEIIHLNVVTLTQLTHLFLKEMEARDSGKILQLGSVAGFQPGPLFAVYHASKAFVVSLSEALMTELEEKGSKVTITCLCPGPTDTNFFSRADMENTRVYQNKEKLMQQPEEVAEGAFKALMDGERSYIPGAMNKVMTFTRRVIPKKLQAKMQMKFYEETEA
jgi:short-subunit dehydrogenase